MELELSQLEALILSPKWELHHDKSCDRLNQENPIEWDCDCFLSEILELIKTASTPAVSKETLTLVEVGDCSLCGRAGLGNRGLFLCRSHINLILNEYGDVRLAQSLATQREEIADQLRDIFIPDYETDSAFDMGQNFALGKAIKIVEEGK